MPLDYNADMLGTTLSAIFDWYGDAAPQQAESIHVFLDALDEQQEEAVDQRIQGIASHFDQILEDQVTTGQEAAGRAGSGAER